MQTKTFCAERISYGCINVPVEFFKRVVAADFTGTNGIVYVLPETRSAQQVFASYDVDRHAPLPPAGQGLTRALPDVLGR